MDKEEFKQLFLKVLDEAVVNAEQRFGIPIHRSFEIELHGAGYSGADITPEEALDALFIDNEHFYRIIDVAVIEIHATKTRVFVRVSAHKPSAFAETWNQPAGMGPFKQILADRVRIFDGLDSQTHINVSDHGEQPVTSNQKNSSLQPNFYDLTYLDAQRRQVVAVAQDVLSSKKGVIEGARLLVELRPTVTRDAFDPDFLPFVAIVSETDELPIGKERDLWASSALEEKDKIIRRVEETYREGAWEACRVLIERFSANIGIELMGMFNYLLLNVICPRCGVEAEMEAEFRFGLRDLSRYRIGDRLRWDGMGVKTPKTRPEEGNYDDDAYVVCPHCERDFWLLVSVRNDVIVNATVDPSKQPYISDDDIQPQATSPTVQSEWDPIAHAEKMKKSTWDVSAFFLIDSLNAFSKCTQWLSLLKPCNMPDMEHSPYFIDVREIYQSGKEVINFDYDFKLFWENKSFPAKLRCHFVEKGKYEIELWLPGVIANEVADKFKDGHEGFWCAFMPPAFYD